MSSLQNPVAIITGSTRGIGYSTAEVLLQKGYRLVINGSTESGVEKALFELKKINDQVVGLAKPVEMPETGQELVDLAIRNFGEVNVLINSAGIVKDKISYRMELQDFFDVINVHVNGTFYCIKPFINQVKGQKSLGHIINFTSTSGFEGNVGQVNYSAAKSAINSLTWTLAKELKDSGIIVNGIAPLAITSMTKPFIKKMEERLSSSELEKLGVNKMAEPEHIARFICSILFEHDLTRTGNIYGVNAKEVSLWHPPCSEKITLK